MGRFRCKESECIKCGRENCLRSIPLLSNLSDEEAQKISKGVSTEIFRKGEQLFKKGDTANKLFILCSGRIKLFKHTKEGKEQIIYIMSKGDFFGAFNLLKEDEMELDAVAIEDSHVSLLEKREFDKIILSNPEITLKVFEKAYERIMKAEALVERLSANSPDSRVAGLMLNLIEDFGSDTDDGVLLKLSINREEMGSYAGIARETMSRKLNQFQEMGIISLLGSKQILLRDVEALEDMK